MPGSSNLSISLHGGYTSLGVFIENKDGRNSINLFLPQDRIPIVAPILFLSHVFCCPFPSITDLLLECFFPISNLNMTFCKLFLVFSLVDRGKSLVLSSL